LKVGAPVESTHSVGGENHSGREMVWQYSGEKMTNKHEGKAGGSIKKLVKKVS